MTQPENTAALAELAGHPYVLVGSAAPHTDRLSGPLPVAEVLDLGFGAADALVEVHARGLTEDGLGAGSLVRSASGEPRLALCAVRVGGAADRAVDVSALRTALAGLLAKDDDDPTIRATRSVLSHEPVQTAAALRDSLAAVRLGTLPPRPLIPSPDAMSPTATGGERVGGAADPAQRLHGKPDPDRSTGRTAATVSRRARTFVLVAAVLLVLVVAVWLLMR